MSNQSDIMLLALLVRQLGPKDLVEIHYSFFIDREGSVAVSEPVRDLLEAVRQTGAAFEVFGTPDTSLQKVQEYLEAENLSPPSLIPEPEHLWIVHGALKAQEEFSETMQSLYRPGTFEIHHLPEFSEILYGTTDLSSEDERLVEALFGGHSLEEISSLDLDRSQIEHLLDRFPEIEKRLYQLNRQFKKGAAESFLQNFFDRLVYLQRYFCPAFKLDLVTHPAEKLYTAAGVFPVYRIKDPDTGQEKAHVLMGKRSDTMTWVTLGGESDSTDSDLSYTAARETFEESGDRLIIPSVILRSSPCHELQTVKPDRRLYLYRMYVIELDEPVDVSDLKYHEYVEYQWVPVEQLTQAFEQDSPDALKCDGKFIDIDGEKQRLYEPFIQMLSQKSVQEHLRCIVENKSYTKPDTPGYHLQSPAEKRHEMARLASQHGQVLRALKERFSSQDSSEVTSQMSQANVFFRAAMPEKYFKPWDLAGNMGRFIEKSAYSEFFRDPAVLKHFTLILQEEALANARGDLVFYHATSSPVAFLIHFFTALRQRLDLVSGDQFKAFRGRDNFFKIIADVEALIKAFDTEGDGKIDNYDQYYSELGISLNAFLFGNDGIATSSSVYYYLTNYSNAPPNIFKELQMVLIQFGLEDTWIRALTKMYQEHVKDVSRGHLYQIILTAESARQYIYIAKLGGALNPLEIDGKKTCDPVEIFNAVRQAPERYANYIQRLQARMLVHPAAMSLARVREYTLPGAPLVTYTEAMAELADSMVEALLEDAREKDFYEEPRLLRQMRYRAAEEGLSQVPVSAAVSLVTAIFMGEHEVALKMIEDYPETDLMHLPHNHDIHRLDQGLDLLSLLKESLEQNEPSLTKREQITLSYVLKIIESGRLPMLLGEACSFLAWKGALFYFGRHESVRAAWAQYSSVVMTEFLDAYFKEHQAEMVDKIRDVRNLLASLNFLSLDQELLPELLEKFHILKDIPSLIEAIQLLEYHPPEWRKKTNTTFARLVRNINDCLEIIQGPYNDPETRYILIELLGPALQNYLKQFSDFEAIFKLRALTGPQKETIWRTLREAGFQPADMFHSVTEFEHAISLLPRAVRTDFLEQMLKNLPGFVNNMEDLETVCHDLDEVERQTVLTSLQATLENIFETSSTLSVGQFIDLAVMLKDRPDLFDRLIKAAYSETICFTSSAFDLKNFIELLKQLRTGQVAFLLDKLLVSRVSAAEVLRYPDFLEVLNEAKKSLLAKFLLKHPASRARILGNHYDKLLTWIPKEEQHHLWEMLAELLKQDVLRLSPAEFLNHFIVHLKQMPQNFFQTFFKEMQEDLINVLNAKQAKKTAEKTELFLILLKRLEEADGIALIEKTDPSDLFVTSQGIGHLMPSVNAQSFLEVIQCLSVRQLKILLEQLQRFDRPLDTVSVLENWMRQAGERGEADKLFPVAEFWWIQSTKRPYSMHFITFLTEILAETVSNPINLLALLRHSDEDRRDQLMTNISKEKAYQLLKMRQTLTFDELIELMVRTSQYPEFVRIFMAIDGEPPCFRDDTEVSCERLYTHLIVLQHSASKGLVASVVNNFNAWFVRALEQRGEGNIDLLGELSVIMDSRNWEFFLKTANLEKCFAVDIHEPEQGIRLDWLCYAAEKMEADQLRLMLHALSDAVISPESAEYMSQDLDAEFLLDHENLVMIAKFILEKLEEGLLPEKTRDTLKQAYSVPVEQARQRFFKPCPAPQSQEDETNKDKHGYRSGQ